MAPAAGHRMSVQEMMRVGDHRDRQLRWSDVPEVRESLTYMSKNVNLIKFYELKFEIISQEATFNIRLTSLLRSSFTAGRVGLNDTDRKLLFSTIERVWKFSDEFLNDLEHCWRRDIFLTGIFDIIKKHESSFDAYTRHCSGQNNAVHHLQKLKRENSEFAEALDKWQNGSENYSKYDLESILDMPRRRIHTIGMVCESALNLMDKHDAEYKSCLAAIKLTKKIAGKCDQAVDVISRRATLLTIDNQLTFAEHVPQIPIAYNSRELVRNDELTLLTLSGGMVCRLSPRNVILFNDLILITKKVKPKEDRYTILDYCYLNMVELKSTDDLLNVMHSTVLAEAQDKLLLIKFQKNYENKPLLLLFSCALEAVRDDWTRLLVRHIENNIPQPEAKELPDLTPVQEQHTHVPNRTSDQIRIIEELKMKQEARKKDWLIPENVVDEFNEIVEDLPQRKDSMPFHIPRPISRPPSFRATEPPAVLPKPTNTHEERKMSAPQVTKASFEATITFDSLIEYPPGMPVFPLLSASRWTIKSAEMVLRWHMEEKKYSDTKIPIHVTLFNDVLFVTTKKKGDARHKVRSYSLRNLTDITPIRKLSHLPPKFMTDRPNKFMFMIHMLENQKHQAETMVVCVSSAMERESWLNAVPAQPVLSTAGHLLGDQVYDQWDRPMVLAMQPHVPQSRHEIPLEVHDKLHVNKRRADGWYEGVRVSDGRSGIFPISCTVEMESPHKYAREVRQRATSLIRE